MRHDLVGGIHPAGRMEVLSRRSPHFDRRLVLRTLTQSARHRKVSSVCIANPSPRPPALSCPLARTRRITQGSLGIANQILRRSVMTLTIAPTPATSVNCSSDISPTFPRGLRREGAPFRARSTRRPTRPRPAWPSPHKRTSSTNPVPPGTACPRPTPRRRSGSRRARRRLRIGSANGLVTVPSRVVRGGRRVVRRAESRGLRRCRHCLPLVSGCERRAKERRTGRGTGGTRWLWIARPKAPVQASEGPVRRALRASSCQLLEVRKGRLEGWGHLLDGRRLRQIGQCRSCGTGRSS